MRGESFARAISVGGICLLIGLAAGAMPAHAQAQPLTAFSPFDPQWVMANPFGSAGFAGDSGVQQAYAAKWGSGTFGLSVQSGSLSGDFLRSPFAFASSGPQDWFTGPADPAWRTSVIGSFRSNPDAALGGLYSTANFGITSIRANPTALPGLANLYPGNDATAVSASAGLGLQLTPQISIEGSVGFTQGPVSPFR